MEKIITKKNYEFISGGGLHLFSRRFTKAVTNVTVENDHLEIETIPESYGGTNSVYFNDILQITTKTIIGKAYLVCLILSILFALGNPVYFVLSGLCIWLGYNRKIIIKQKIGSDINIYSSSKDAAEVFVNDMRKTLRGNK